MTDNPIQTVQQRFSNFVDACRDSTQLYADLSQQIAHDPEFIEAVLVENGELISQQPLPNLLFAAVNYLSKTYPGLDQLPNPYPSFRAFVLEHREAIRELCRTRLVQTNEVRRCALWIPAFGTVAGLTNHQTLGLVEVGASAGLNLLWDHYHYRYSSGQIIGSPDSELELTCEVRGNPLPLPEVMPTVGYRVGLDLNPVSLENTDDVRWLEALVWVEQTDRADVLHRALRIGAQHPPRILPGDALKLLPEVCAEVPADLALCLYHSFTVNQFTPAMRETFAALIETEARQRERLFRLSVEWLTPDGPELRLVHYEQGRLMEDALLARVDHHGRWIDWQYRS